MGDAGVDHFAEIVRRNVGCHAHRNPARTVDEQVRKLGWQHGGLLQGAVIVVAKVDRLLIQVVEQAAGNLGQPAFGVALGCGRVAIDGAEVALSIHQGQAHGEILRHAHQRIVDRRVAVRVIFTHHLAHDAGALDVLLVPLEPKLVHAKQDAPMHGFETIAHVGQSPAHDHAHGVIEIGAFHFVGDGDRPDVGRAFVTGRSFVVVRHGRTPLALETGSGYAKDEGCRHHCRWLCSRALRGLNSPGAGPEQQPLARLEDGHFMTQKQSLRSTNRGRQGRAAHRPCASPKELAKSRWSEARPGLINRYLSRPESPVRLSLIAYLLGALSLVAGAVALEGLFSRRFTAPALEEKIGDRTPLRDTRPVLLIAGVLFSSGGLALWALSRWAAPIFLLGTLLATAYLLYASRVLPPTDAAQGQGRRRTIMAIYLYAAATALVLWLESQGVLS